MRPPRRSITRSSNASRNDSARRAREPARDRARARRARARFLAIARDAHEEWYRAPGLIRLALRMVGMLERARRSALDIRIVENELPIDGLDAAFDGFTLLHLSDLHVDINDEFLHALIERVRDVDYDVCVLTGDYRAKTYGPIDATLDGMRRLRAHVDAPIYGVLGNHDSIRMVPAFEAMGITMLVNESTTIRRGDASLSARRDRRRALFPRRRYRARRRRRATRRAVDSVVAHPRGLSSGGRGGLRRAVVRPHARRPDLPAGRVSGDARCAHSATIRARAVASSATCSAIRRRRRARRSSTCASTVPPEITLHRLRCG